MKTEIEIETECDRPYVLTVRAQVWTFRDDSNQGSMVNLGQHELPYFSRRTIKSRSLGCTSTELRCERMRLTALSGRVFELSKVPPEGGALGYGAPYVLTLPHGFVPKEIKTTCECCGQDLPKQ